MVTCLNRLGYDALGLGNHDLDYGIDYLRALAGHLEMPMVCSNLVGADLAPIRRSALLDCPVPGDGPGCRLRVGILSVLPGLTAAWNAPQLEGRARIEDPLDCLRRAVPALRKAGADFVVLLAHMAVDTLVEAPQAEDILPPEDFAGIDAVIGGPTHARYPLCRNQAARQVLPAAMPGHAGSDLAVLTLDLLRERGSAWRRQRHGSSLHPNRADLPEAPAILRASAASHERTIAQLEVPLGNTPSDLHNYFALLRPTPTAALLAQALRDVVLEEMSGRPDAGLPVLAAVACTAADLRSRPASFQHIPPGPIRQRDIAALCPFDNPVWGIRLTGAELGQWLEHSARVYRSPMTGRAPGLLLDPDVPGFNCDTVFGIDYLLDPAAPPGRRVGRMTHLGRRVRPDDRFILATTPFRAGGGGGFPACDASRVILRSAMTQVAAVDRLLSDSPSVPYDPMPWRFAPRGRAHALFDTAPGAASFLHEIAELAPLSIGQTPSGFLRLRVTL